MLDGQTGNFAFDFDAHELWPEFPDVEAVIECCSMLPTAVRSAPITSAFERILDYEEMDRLTNPESLERQDTNQLERLQLRRESLRPNLGLLLTCVLIRLPGIHYTIEIDRESGSVVHLEWQRT